MFFSSQLVQTQLVDNLHVGSTKVMAGSGVVTGPTLSRKQGPKPGPKGFYEIILDISCFSVYVWACVL